MLRSHGIGLTVIALTLAAAAGQETSPAAAPVPPVQSHERLITVQEPNREALICRIKETWRQADGSRAYLVEAVETGELISIVEAGDLAAPPSEGRPRLRAVATRIYHWGRSRTPPLGVPAPPDMPAGAVAAERPEGMPTAQRLAPGDLRVSSPVAVASADGPPAGTPSGKEVVPAPAPVKPAMTPKTVTSHGIPSATPATPAPAAPRTWPSAFAGQAPTHVTTMPRSSPAAIQREPSGPVPPPPTLAGRGPVPGHTQLAPGVAGAAQPAPIPSRQFSEEPAIKVPTGAPEAADFRKSWGRIEPSKVEPPTAPRPAAPPVSSPSTVSGKPPVTGPAPVVRSPEPPAPATPVQLPPVPEPVARRPVVPVPAITPPPLPDSSPYGPNPSLPAPVAPVVKPPLPSPAPVVRTPTVPASPDSSPYSPGPSQPGPVKPAAPPVPISVPAGPADGSPYSPGPSQAGSVKPAVPSPAPAVRPAAPPVPISVPAGPADGSPYSPGPSQAGTPPATPTWTPVVKTPLSPPAVPEPVPSTPTASPYHEKEASSAGTPVGPVTPPNLIRTVPVTAPQRIPPGLLQRGGRRPLSRDSSVPAGDVVTGPAVPPPLPTAPVPATGTPVASQPSGIRKIFRRDETKSAEAAGRKPAAETKAVADSGSKPTAAPTPPALPAPPGAKAPDADKSSGPPQPPVADAKEADKKSADSGEPSKSGLIRKLLDRPSRTEKPEPKADAKADADRKKDSEDEKPLGFSLFRRKKDEEGKDDSARAEKKSDSPSSSPSDWGIKVGGRGRETTLPDNLPRARITDNDPLARPAEYSKIPVDKTPRSVPAPEQPEKEKSEVVVKPPAPPAPEKTEVAVKPPAPPAPEKSEVALEPPAPERTESLKPPEPLTPPAPMPSAPTPPAPSPIAVSPPQAVPSVPSLPPAVSETPHGTGNPVAPDRPPGSASVYAAGEPKYIPVPIVTVPDLRTGPTRPPVEHAPQPNAGQYIPQNPLTTPPPGYANAFTRPGPQNPVPAETLPPEGSTNAFADPPIQGQGTPPPAVPALARNFALGGFVPTVGYPGPMPYPGQHPQAHPGHGPVALPPGAMHPGMPMPPMQGMPHGPGGHMPMPTMPQQQMGPGVPGVAWVPAPTYMPANYFPVPGAPMNAYAMPAGAVPMGYPPAVMQHTSRMSAPESPEEAPNVELLLKMLRESDYPSQREWAADQLCAPRWTSSPQVVNSLLMAAKGDPAPMVRAQAIRSLARMGVQTLGVANALHELQADSDPRVREAVREAMTSMGIEPAKTDSKLPAAEGRGEK